MWYGSNNKYSTSDEFAIKNHLRLQISVRGDMDNSNCKVLISIFFHIISHASILGDSGDERTEK